MVSSLEEQQMEFINLPDIRDDLVHEGVELFAKAKAEGREMSADERVRDEEIDLLLRKVAAQIKRDEQTYGRSVHLRVKATNDNARGSDLDPEAFIYTLT